ncbi:MAG: hydroxymethylglutaryl-CoA lyase [Solirubrobacteraceae bacterium]
MPVTLIEVGPRDGLQSEATVLTPAQRVELCERLERSGLRRVEATSFVRPDLVPAMHGADQVMRGLPDGLGTTWSALVLNERGYDRALAVGAGEVRYSIPMSDTFGERNQGTTVEAATVVGESLLRRAADDGVSVSFVLSVSFGCPFEGAVPATRIAGVVQRLAEAGGRHIILGDSIGVGIPTQVRDLVASMLALGVEVGGHFHNTRNTGYVNAVAAVEAGATTLDSSVGGIGGCPFIPGATGNIATEDLVYLLHGMGYDTGVDLDALIDCSLWLSGLLGHPLSAQLSHIARLEGL